MTHAFRTSRPSLARLGWICLVSLAATPALRSAERPPAITAAAGLTEVYRVNLEQNLRWMLLRERAEREAERAGGPTKTTRVGVLADAGVWHAGARSIVEALESQGTACRVLDRSLMTEQAMSGLKALVLPGGWAPYQWGALDEPAQDSVRQLVERGGCCVGVCAGAYLVSQTVRYEGESFSYPLRLFAGIARGPVPGLAKFPERGAVRLRVTEAGVRLGMSSAGQQDVYYSGGPCLEGLSGAETLACYPDGSAAVIQVRRGQGRLILTGVHFERPAPPGGDELSPPPDFAGPLLQSLIAERR